MDVKIEEINETKYRKLTSNFKNDLPLWLQPDLTKFYKNKIFLTAYKGNSLLGIWIVPIVVNFKKKIAQREYRYLPYCSPYIFVTNNLKRRNVMHALFKYLTNSCQEINLPFDPSYDNYAPIQELGGFVEMRHTHILESAFIYAKLPGRIKNHISNAHSKTDIIFSNDPTQFKFNLAIKGTNKEQIERKKLAAKMLKTNKAIVAIATNKNNACSGILIAYDSKCAYMMHSWQEKTTPRGTMSALIYEASNLILSDMHIPKYDFEGSVFQRIDYYYSGFNCNITPYGHVYWSKDKKTLHDMIDRSINIPGRIINHN